MYELRECSVCCNITVSNLCSICSDSRRDQHIIMVVETPRDVLKIEDDGGYNGLYHVLHGAISPVKSIGPDKLRIRELVKRIEENSTIKEVIIATHSTQEGDATAMFIHRNSLAGKQLKITRFHLSGLS